ncbi:hydantoinase/oxoprolinase family protein [Agrobacterium rubi]|uniref:Hydantoinase/oxoprolinase family protein n=2 Tax=Rhizobium/Agrobacterium group TaxID=227290 RepID=A0AAE7UTA6_9HYPH|nr:hydantoinase/oxoprolinase family protein [Agrobacterium rubi]MBN7809215.1 hydantoinase/oxoprolinase family protein [Agrobacterium rosae]NTE89843.1 hydantoinase/oxoprolinase family protein [Agrobacterium rubi]NTF05307.1 hydantoinase/oxoprolinase family protein [Agrobacterium rubi]NTF39751.1 hydantoinase/oxoprolinase family protein [Agrobacterium rubi]OCJ44996.1 methylhydantoinase [Agrobacterium rubi]
MVRIGVDVGGTFTDLILEDTRGGTQRILVHKVSSTVHDQSIGVVRGIVELCELAQVRPDEVDMVFHGTTVATNMAIERDGAEVGMITTRGFRDILHMARHKRAQNFSLQFDIPWQTAPLVKRRNRLVVTERILPPEGTIEQPLNEAEVREAAETLKKRGIKAIVVAFLFSFLNDAHEKRAKEIVLEVIPDAYVSVSSEIVNMMREYERFSTTAMNAYIGPRTAKYLNQLRTRLHEAGINSPVRIMQSNGGISTIENSSERPVGLLLSGPAGGVIGGRATGAASASPNVITIDIGGTSADISVIQNGNLAIKNPRDTQVAELPVLVPMLDIDAIGAGGGSIAYIDGGGAFRVGPRSAGAFPGPACYGLGGAEPTVTDAQVALGRLDPDLVLGGQLKLDRELSIKAIEEKIAKPLGLTVEQAALGILRIVNNTMALAVNANSVSKGIDPRLFSLMAFGGAGPLHGVALGEIIGTKDVISPIYPGITAAVGLLATELQYEYTKPTFAVLNNATDEQLKAINEAYGQLEKEGNAQLEADGIPAEKRHFERVVECRYLGQGFELRADAPGGTVDANALKKVINNFYDVHKQTYGHAFEDQLVQAVTLRVIAKGATRVLKFPEIERGGRENPEDAKLFVRDTIFDDGKPVATPRYARGKLLADDTVAGPAIITQHNSTTVVPPGFTATVLSHGDITVSR